MPKIISMGLKGHIDYVSVVLVQKNLDSALVYELRSFTMVSLKIDFNKPS